MDRHLTRTYSPGNRAMKARAGTRAESAAHGRVAMDAEREDSLAAKRHYARKRGGGYIFCTIFLAAALAGFFALSVTVFFNIEQIEVQGNARYSKEEIIAASGAKAGDNLLKTRPSEIENMLLERLPYLSSVRVVRKLPSTLRIEVVESSRTYLLDCSLGLFILSEDLRVLEKADASQDYGLLILKGFAVESAPVGQKAVFSDEESAGIIQSVAGALRETGLYEDAQWVDGSSKYSLKIAYGQKFVIRVGDVEEIEYKLKFARAIIDACSESDRGIIDVSDTEKGVLLPDSAESGETQIQQEGASGQEDVSG